MSTLLNSTTVLGTAIAPTATSAGTLNDDGTVNTSKRNALIVTPTFTTASLAVGASLNAHYDKEMFAESLQGYVESLSDEELVAALEEANAILGEETTNTGVKTI